MGDVPQLVREQPFDVAFIAVKAYDTAWATQLILPYLAPAGCLVSLQNGINEDTIAAIAGWERTLGCSVSALAAELVAPGRIVRNSPLGDDEEAGHAHRRGARADHAARETIAGLLAHGDTCKVTQNLWGERWSKLTINAMRNGVCALTGMSGKERDTNDVARELSSDWEAPASASAGRWAWRSSPSEASTSTCLPARRDDPAAHARQSRE